MSLFPARPKVQDRIGYTPDRAWKSFGISFNQWRDIFHCNGNTH